MRVKCKKRQPIGLAFCTIIDLKNEGFYLRKFKFTVAILISMLYTKVARRLKT